MKKASRTSRGAPQRRGYDASRRQADAQQRHRRVVESAGRLFLAKGFGATSINEIAAAAEVSPQTVYATFGSKAGVLAKALDVAITGDYDDVPMVDRPQPWMQGEGVDPFRVAAGVARESAIRVGPLLRVVESAAATDGALDELRLQLISALRADCAVWLREFPAELLRPGLDEEQTADVMALIASAGTYMTLVADMGWSPEQYEDWLADCLVRLLGR